MTSSSNIITAVAALILAVGTACAAEAAPATDTAWTTKDTITLTVAIVGAVTGVLGAVLGGINTWNAISARRVHIRVKPSMAHSLTHFDAEPLVGIEVVNLSTFAVTITEVGFTLVGTKARGAVIAPILFDGGKMPRRLEAREAFTVYSQKPDPKRSRVHKVYARLASGEQITGTGPAMKELRA